VIATEAKCIVKQNSSVS